MGRLNPSRETRHARGQGNIIFPVQLPTSSIGNLTGLIHTLLYVMTIHAYYTTVLDYRLHTDCTKGGEFNKLA